MKWNADLDSFVIDCSINCALCAAIGALLEGGPRGAAMGVGAGLILSTLPLASRIAARWMGRLGGGFVVALGIPAALAMIAIGQSARRVAAWLSPAVEMLAPALAGIHRAVGRLRLAAAQTLAGAAGLLTRPLGLANVGALTLIILDLAGIEFAPVVTTLGFLMLCLILIVDDYEQRQVAPDSKEQP